MKHWIALMLLAAGLVAACHRPAEIDPLLRARADGLNKEAFVNRYRDPQRCVELSAQALAFVADSLPAYADGALRARNNMAFAYYQMSDYGQASAMLSHIERQPSDSRPGMRNRDIEWVIAELLQARMLQRQCRIADSYRLLYRIEQSRVLEHSHGHLLYSYAQAEYYITTLTLSYHYRDGEPSDVRSLLEEVEAARQGLQVDFAEDMALNYALAYGWQQAGESVRALDWCDRTLDLLELHPAAFCTYHYANTLQMCAAALKSLPGTVPPDSVLALYDQARRLFFDYGDPYQMLGGVNSTARYALLVGDTAKAHQVLGEWMSLRGRWEPFSAPKMELSLFDLLIRSRLATSPDQVRRWYMRHAELRDYMAQNEREDFALQQGLEAATRRSRWMAHTAMLLGVLVAALLALALLLWRNARRLRREKRQLEAAKRRDVERIANVETCLSVMRHDVSPFLGYLRNPSLPDDLRDEVLGQLLRTFDNIKNWTHLSIPSGLTFSGSDFAVQALFDEVGRQVLSPAAGVSLRFEPTRLRLWGDRLLLTILLRNLVNNALQHTAEGSVVVSAQAEADGWVDLRVADTGCGMTDEQREGLFRADRPLAGEHGFGLILCRHIIKKHDDQARRGCKLQVESAPGSGTTVHALLPAQRTDTRQFNN